jgi:hypothetical protein
VMEQWCLWFRLFYVIFKLLRYHWSYSVLLQFIGSVILHLLVTQDHLTKIVIKQWWDSDDILFFCNALGVSCSRFWDVIDHMPSFCNAFEVIFKVLRFHWSILLFCNAYEVWLCLCWWHKTILQLQWSNSDETVMEQWSNSDETVMQQWCLRFELFYVICTVLRCNWD